MRGEKSSDRDFFCKQRKLKEVLKNKSLKMWMKMRFWLFNCERRMIVHILFTQLLYLQELQHQIQHIQRSQTPTLDTTFATVNEKLKVTQNTTGQHWGDTKRHLCRITFSGKLREDVIYFLGELLNFL
ncbi:hypothetical protein ATI61_111138 [Archangium gephyra]|uniref:Uncharacterized protein n=1 Tax=Archangium gephyra TaxID=48 RepID=A0ABX9JT17_9BACT|nr:hypothetical protein ATI61_111138 [Archangium gephyra]